MLSQQRMFQRWLTHAPASARVTGLCSLQSSTVPPVPRQTQPGAHVANIIVMPANHCGRSEESMLQDMSLAMRGGHLVRSSIKGSSAYLVKVEEKRSIKVCAGYPRLLP